jgi:hypothetical protein
MPKPVMTESIRSARAGDADNATGRAIDKTSNTACVRRRVSHCPKPMEPEKSVMNTFLAARRPPPRIMPKGSINSRRARPQGARGNILAAL